MEHSKRGFPRPFFGPKQAIYNEILTTDKKLTHASQFLEVGFGILKLIFVDELQIQKNVSHRRKVPD